MFIWSFQSLFDMLEGMESRPEGDPKVKAKVITLIQGSADAPHPQKFSNLNLLEHKKKLKNVLSV